VYTKHFQLPYSLWGVPREVNRCARPWWCFLRPSVAPIVCETMY
jgi:hypothetical protein